MLLADSFSYSHIMSSTHNSHAPAQVAEKVLRRIEIAKVARNLHDCLAFASFKAQNGWQDRTLKSIEPEVTEKLKRKRHPFADDTASDDSSSCTEEEFIPTTSIASNRFSRPSTSATFKVPDYAYTTSRKRVRSASTTAADTLSHSTHWKLNNGLAQSSPVLSRTDHGFDTATIPRPSHEDSPMFDAPSDNDDQDVQLPSFAEPSSSIVSSSPPRTPPPTRRLHDTSKQSGADLLLYLANSPSRSPAINVTHISSSSKDLPSTPPSQHAHLPSSVMNTPGQTLGLFNGALQTPGPNFNFADFCNVTPSPAQAQWGGRTPALAKTPSRLGQRPLNFDHLQPPTSGAHLQRRPPTSQGLALQLGEELMPRS